MNRKTLLLLALATGLFFQGCEKKDYKPQTPTEQDISKSTEEYTHAFNVKDLDKLSSLWTEDAVYANFSTGETIEGSENISNYFKKQFDENGAKTINVTLSSISSSGDNTALAKGLMETTFENKDPIKESFYAEYEKNGSAWAINSFSVNTISTPPSHFEELKDLDWLVGDWIDEDDDIDVTYEIDWDKNRNFLTQHFVSTILGEEEISGTQIIGWNPTTKKIQSWIFDSDGGFGESEWSKEGEQWIAKLNFTLPQGGNASATHIYTKIDKDSYSFASENREVEGNLLPNIGPFKIVRQ